MNRPIDKRVDSVEELEEIIEIEEEIDVEFSRYSEECGEVVSYNRGYCPLPNFGDWRDRRYGLSVWSVNVRKRDKYTCRKCKGKTNLHAHHIYNKFDNPDIQYEEWNGITLCKYCHASFHRTYGKRFNDEVQLKEFMNDDGIY